MTEQETVVPSSRQAEEVKPQTAEPQQNETIEDTTTSSNSAPATAEVNDAEPVVEAVDVLPAEDVQAQLLEAEHKAAEYWEKLLRQQADHENLRKRMERDLEKAHKFALEKFMQELLPVKDSMEMGLEAAEKTETDATLFDGMQMTLKIFNSALQKFGLQEIDPKDQKFDPEYHEAMVMQPSAEVEPNTVLIVHQKGYLLNERLLRPARVVVSREP